MRTTLGDITIRLYDDTPKHTANFLKLAKEGYYDGTLFHRVIRDFMIQGGDPDSRNAKPGQPLGMGDPDYTVPAEFVYPKYFHKRGALAAARQGDNVNPEKASSGSQFYIVTGKVYTPVSLTRWSSGSNISRCSRYSTLWLPDSATPSWLCAATATVMGCSSFRIRL